MEGEQSDESGYASLRRNRIPQPGSEYFLTINLAERGDNLALHGLIGEIRSKWEKLGAARQWIMRTAVVMPDHLHLLIVLGEGADLSASIRQFKGRLAPSLRRMRLHWQDGYYDRKLRDSDDRQAVFLYIYLNPYRSGLIPADARWPGYYCAAEDWAWFGELTDQGCPMPEWLQ
jgi:REP element-mobilizing transposase RayT